MKANFILLTVVFSFAIGVAQASSVEVNKQPPLEFLPAINVQSLESVELESLASQVNLSQGEANFSIQALNISFLDSSEITRRIFQEVDLDSIALVQTSSLNSFQAINYVGN